MTKTPRVKVTQFIRGKKEDVFSAWIRPELAVQWFSPMELKPVSFRNDPKIGGTYHHVMSGEPGTFTTIGEYLEIVENEKLVFTWGAPGTNTASVVTVELTDHDGGTLVTLTHEKLPIDQEESHQSGWESALRHMSQFFAERKAR